MADNDEVTITVQRKDLQLLLHAYDTYGAGIGSGTPAGKAAARIEAAIPPPPWEPSTEQVDAFLKGNGYGTAGDVPRLWATDSLKRLHAAGLRLP